MSKKNKTGSPADVTSEDLATLLKLGFNVSEKDGFFLADIIEIWLTYYKKSILS